MSITRNDIFCDATDVKELQQLYYGYWATSSAAYLLFDSDLFLVPGVSKIMIAHCEISIFWEVF